jgi:CDP-diacylglycerol--glycerol-3-phosphate 3-phosphatidyltransferase
MVLFILVVATDALDGYLARKYKQVTDFGRIADPVADKVLICGTFIFICASEWGGPYLPAWLVVVIVAREFLVTGMRGFIEARGQSFAATWSGKLKMMFQSFAIPALFLRQIVASAFPAAPRLETAVRYLAFALLGVALLLTVYSGVLYTVRAAKILGSRGE